MRAYIHRGGAHWRVSTTFWLGKTLTIFSCAPDVIWTSGHGIHWISRPTASEHIIFPIFSQEMTSPTSEQIIFHIFSQEMTSLTSEHIIFHHTKWHPQRLNTLYVISSQKWHPQLLNTFHKSSQEMTPPTSEHIIFHYIPSQEKTSEHITFQGFTDTYLKWHKGIPNFSDWNAWPTAFLHEVCLKDSIHFVVIGTPKLGRRVLHEHIS